MAGDGGDAGQEGPGAAAAVTAAALPERLRGARVEDLGSALNLFERTLDVTLSFEAEEGTSSSSSPRTLTASIPSRLEESHCREAAAELAADLAARAGRSLEPLEKGLLELELRDLAALRGWAVGFVPPLAGGHEAFLLGGPGELPEEVDLAEYRQSLHISLEEARVSPWTFGGGLSRSLHLAARQRAELEAEAAEALARCQALESTPASSSRAVLKDVQFAEIRASWWVDAADGLLQMLEKKGVQRGQVIAIDAHTGNPEEEAAFSAHYSLRLPGSGKLGIRYKRTEMDGEDFSWQGLYDWANREASNRQVISMTASCSREGGGVCTCFYYADACDLADIQVLECRAAAWNAAASELAAALRTGGARAGQVLWVDAHRQPGSDGVAFAAHFSRSLPGRGELVLKYEASDGKKSFRELHAWAAARIMDLGLTREDLVSITYSSDDDGAPTCYLFYWGSAGDEPPLGDLPGRAEGKPEPLQPGDEVVAAKLIEVSESNDFEVLEHKVVFLGADAHVMKADDLEACKTFCRKQRFGAFIVTNKMAYFRRETAEKCVAHLVDDPRSTTYLRRSAPSLGPLARLQRGWSRSQVRTSEVNGTVRHDACQCAAQ